MAREDGAGPSVYEGSGCGFLVLLVVLGAVAVLLFAAHRGLL